MGLKLMDPDMFKSVNVPEVANATMAVIDTIQDTPPHVRVAAISCAFLLMCERVGIEPQDAFSVVTNLMNFADGKRPEFAAVKAYLEGEV